MDSFESRYSAVLFPDRPIVAGFKLEAPQLGHLFLLWRMGCLPLKREVGKLVTALYILSRPWQQAAKGLQRRWIKARLKIWGVQFHLICTAYQRKRIAEEIEDHLDNAWSGPELWEGDESGNSLGAPFLQVLKCRLMHLFNISRDEALSYSLREAVWDVDCHMEDHGRVEFVSEEWEARVDKAHRVADMLRAFQAKQDAKAKEEKANG
jgi:hypothetical protein